MRDSKTLWPPCMPGAIEQFFSRPNKRTYLLARRVIVARSDYRIRESTLHDLQEQLNAGRYSEVLERADELCESLPLNARLYFLAGVAACELGRVPEADRYRERFQACLRGLLGTGDGTLKRPFIVTYLSDERDLLQSLGLRASRQSVVESRSRALDLLECEDGTVIYCEVSDLLFQLPPQSMSSKSVRVRQRGRNRVRKVAVPRGRLGRTAKQ